MAVYVDPLLNHGWVLKGQRVKSCHLLADTDEELHAFAQRLGLKREWAHDGSLLHYDLVASKRSRAVQLGAEELSSFKQAALVYRKLRSTSLRTATKAKRSRRDEA